MPNNLVKRAFHQDRIRIIFSGKQGCTGAPRARVRPHKALELKAEVLKSFCAGARWCRVRPHRVSVLEADLWELFCAGAHRVRVRAHSNGAPEPWRRAWLMLALQLQKLSSHLQLPRTFSRSFDSKCRRHGPRGGPVSSYSTFPLRNCHFRSVFGFFKA